MLFRRLSVFASGWILEAAEAVCGGEGVEVNDVLDILSRLIDKSLVIVEEQESGVRYRFLETIRQYAREKLVEASETEQWQTRHLEFYLRLAEQAEPRLRSGEQLEWFNRLEAEHDNLRAAFGFALERNHVADALGFAAALWRFWNVRGYWAEGRQWLTRALAKSTARDAMRAKALYALSMLCWFNEDHLAMLAPIQESLPISKELGEKRGIAEAINALGMFYGRSGNTILFDREMYAKALALNGESLALWRELGDPWGIAESLMYVGFGKRDLGDPVTSRVLLEESLALWRELGDRWGIAWTLNGLGFTVKVQGDYQRAISYFTESYNTAEQLGERRIMFQSLGSLAQMAEYQGDYALARSWAAKELKWAQSTSAPHSII
ncbi:MAG: tetratricopeptide repeat protein, partial [Chloroflexota bacterium]|nr:tetratricopeptide repeat protein [Chloroflexota bacterium]